MIEVLPSAVVGRSAVGVIIAVALLLKLLLLLLFRCEKGGARKFTRTPSQRRPKSFKSFELRSSLFSDRRARRAH
jgi:hypothetical protein